MDSNRAILEDFIENHPFAASRVLQTMEDEEISDFIQELSAQMSMRLLSLMNSAKSSQCFLSLHPKKQAELLNLGDTEAIELILRAIDDPIREELILKLPRDKMSEIRRRLDQVPNSVGVFMLPATTAAKTATVVEAMQIVKSNHEHFDYQLYIVNLEGVLEGVVPFNKLVAADDNETMENLMSSEVPRFLADTPIKNLINHPAWMNYNAIPVIDASERLLGTLSFLSVKELSIVEGQSQSKEILKVGSALGELYLMGFTGILQAVGK